MGGYGAVAESLDWGVSRPRETGCAKLLSRSMDDGESLAGLMGYV